MDAFSQQDFPIPFTLCFHTMHLMDTRPLVGTDFDAVVGDFYRAATGDLAWGGALDGVQRMFSARAAVIQSVDLCSGRIVHLVNGGPPMHAAFLDYLRDWHARDPRRQHLIGHAHDLLGRWWHCHEHIEEAIVRRDPFYRHFLPAHETRYLATTMLMSAPGLLTAFAIELPADRGPLTTEERDVAQRLGQHFSDAFRAWERVRKMAARALTGHSLLAAFPYPMWLVDESRFVFFANSAARLEQERDELVGLSGGRLVLRAPRADQHLGAWLLGLPKDSHGARTVLDARRQTAAPPLWVHLCTLQPSKVLGAFGDRPLVLATLFDPLQVPTLDPFALAEVFGFTPAEARVAVLLADALSAKQIACRLGCATSTVRTHTRQVLGKLGATRMTDAVRLLQQGGALWQRAGPPE